MRRRINNFHKSKPIVQNVKTDSVNEGKAPKPLTLSNDISDWNPGISAEQLGKQIKEAEDTAKEFASKTSQGSKNIGGAAAPTSYSQAVDRFIRVNQATNRYINAFKEYNDAKEAMEQSNKQIDKAKNAKDSLQPEYDDAKKELSTTTTKLNDVIKRFGAESKQAKQVQADHDKISNSFNELDTQMKEIETNLKTAEKGVSDYQNKMDSAEKTGTKAQTVLTRFKAPIPKLEDPVKEDPVKEVPKEEDPIKEVPKLEEPVKEVPKLEEPVKEVPREEEPAKELEKKVIDGKFEPVELSPEEATAIAKPEQGYQARALTSPNDELIPKEAEKTAKSHLNPEIQLDMHEAAKAGGIGLDIITDGAREAIFTSVTRCSDGALLYANGSLKSLDYPEFWVSPTGATHQNTGQTRVNHPEGHIKIDSSQLWPGNYAGPTGLTSC